MSNSNNSEIKSGNRHMGKKLKAYIAQIETNRKHHPNYMDKVRLLIGLVLLSSVTLVLVGGSFGLSDVNKNHPKPPINTNKATITNIKFFMLVF